MYLMLEHSEQQICDSDHYLVVAEVRERLAANKQRLHRLHIFNIKKLNDVRDKEQNSC
jgi:hypothetical protein